MRFAKPVAAVTVAAALAGCGTNTVQQVRAKVQQFAAATAAHDYRTICQDVLAPALLADMVRGGIGCEQAMRIALAGVHSPNLAIGNVTVSGDRASVLTISQARGQKSVLTSLRLVNTSSGWRISGLGSPVG